ncbi:hypothetical protein SAMN05216574_108104 [Blastococcus tunisiensis]|uniref:Uncharacterized protein n=1 Tax=Blastococcus tunisiensis TaxID=1798228 RepID=A0A1I2FGV4_9ACTN|nr:hypothetical protein SAMN05216574_108104 [Blastococcus sp. DSM 46838]
MTSDLAPPVARPQPPRPRALRLSAGFWFAACLAGVIALVATMLDGDALRADLTATATADNPSSSLATIEDGVRITILVVLGAVTLLVVSTLVWTVLLLRRRSWARWALLVTGVLTLFAVDVAQSLVAGGGRVDRIAFVAQAGLVALGLITLWARSTRTWLRARET